MEKPERLTAQLHKILENLVEKDVKIPVASLSGVSEVRMRRIHTIY